jgi:drug/metabolite transporter, DME family
LSSFPSAGFVARPAGRSGSLLVIAAASSWGTWSLFLRPTGLPAIVTAPILFIVMGVLTLPFALRGPGARWDRITVGLIVANAVFDALNVLTFFAAMQQTTIAIAVLSHYAAPILIALAAPRIDGVTVPGARTAAVVALTGLVIILEPWSAPSEGAVLGVLLGAASAVCSAGNMFTVRRIAARIGPTRALCYHSLLAGAMMLPLVIAHAAEISVCDLALLVSGSATIGAVSGVVFAIGLTRIGTARAAILTFFEPIVAVALGAIVWDEPLHPMAMFGGALVLGAGIQVARKAR